jgi:hypothetical protein
MVRLTDFDVRQRQNIDLLREADHYRMVKLAEQSHSYDGFAGRRVNRLNVVENGFRNWLVSLIVNLSPGLACRLNISPC